MDFEYINRKGKNIKLDVTLHAANNFICRWNKLHPDTLIKYENVSKKLAELFARASKIKNLSGEEKRRLKRYASDTMFFRESEFTFIVQNKTIVTVEISQRDMRYLNKRHPR